MFKKMIILCSVLSVLTVNELFALRIAGEPFIETQYSRASVAQAVGDYERKGHSNNAAKGLVGELVAERKMQEDARLGGKPLVSIRSIFEQNGCEVSFRHSGDRGIDNVFVVQDPLTRWIDTQYSPVFHESKFRSDCRPVLSSTNTLSEQLSLNWLKANLDKAKIKTDRMCMTFPSGNELTFTTCDRCRSKFREQLSWLEDSLKSESFIRTVSVLCPDGRFQIFTVTDE